MMFRRVLCAVLSLGAVLALAGPALAGEALGSIRVTLQNGETVVPDGSVSLYQVGTPYDGDFRLTEAFGGGMIQEEDAMSPALAQWLAEMAEEDGVERLLDADGSAEFTDLPEGLYLLVQTEASTGYHLMEPMTVMLPCEYQWHVHAYPRTDEIVWAIAPEPNPATGQSPLPFLGAAGVVLSGTGLALCWFKRKRT